MEYFLNYNFLKITPRNLDGTFWRCNWITKYLVFYIFSNEKNISNVSHCDFFYILYLNFATLRYLNSKWGQKCYLLWTKIHNITFSLGGLDLANLYNNHVYPSPSFYDSRLIFWWYSWCVLFSLITCIFICGFCGKTCFILKGVQYYCLCQH